MKECYASLLCNNVTQRNLIKFDFLGLKTLTVIKQALSLILETIEKNVDIDKIPLDDEATYQLCSEGKTTGVFQLESSGMKDLLRRLRPEVFEDIVALVALYRPGPLGSNMIDEFINRCIENIVIFQWCSDVNMCLHKIRHFNIFAQDN